MPAKSHARNRSPKAGSAEGFIASCLRQRKPLRGKDIQAIAAALSETGRSAGKFLEQLDRECRFTADGRRAFEALLSRHAVHTAKPIGIPDDDTPVWQRGNHPLAAFRSTPDLPAEVDIAIIGAGLTGAAAAYHLRDDVKTKRLRVAVFDSGDPAGEASGRNGGNFETIPENSIGSYAGLTNERLKFLRKLHPGVMRAVLEIEAARQATAILGLALRNRERLQQIVESNDIDCDFSPKGWLFLTSSRQEEESICDEALIDNRSGIPVEIWSGRTIEKEMGFGWPFLGRFVPGDGSYHPFKYTLGLLKVFLASGGLLYCRTKITMLSHQDGHHLLKTDQGEVRAKRVIVATNAFTSRLLPELQSIRPRQSQIILTEDVEDRTRGKIVSSDFGPVYFQQPRSTCRNGYGALLMGGGADRPMSNPSSRRRSPHIHKKLLALRDHFFPDLEGRPPSAEWVGPCGFTPDQIPAIGELRPGLVIAAGFSGYGGSYTTVAGEAAAHIALTGHAPDWLTEDVFSPRRLLRQSTTPLRDKDGLWIISQSVSRLLMEATRKLKAGLEIAAGTEMPRHPATPAQSGIRVSGAGLQNLSRGISRLPGFEDFSLNEIGMLLARSRLVQFSAGDTIIEQGSIGDCCYLILEGKVRVENVAGASRMRLSEIETGAIFGEIGMFLGVERTAKCLARTNAVLLRLDAKVCRSFFRRNDTFAAKLFATINRNTIESIHSSNHSLVRRLKTSQQFIAGTVHTEPREEPKLAVGLAAAQ